MLELYFWIWWLLIASSLETSSQSKRIGFSQRNLLDKIQASEKWKTFDASNCPFIPILSSQEDVEESLLSQPIEMDPKSVPMRCNDHKDGREEFLLVASTGLRSKDDLWMAKHLTIPYKLYHAENTSMQYHHSNHGKEAAVYLKFIAEHYECLPEVTLFAHSHRERTWHRSTTLDEAIGTLNWETIKEHGFAILDKLIDTKALWTDQFVKDPERHLFGHEIDHEKKSYAHNPDCHHVINGTLYDHHAAYLHYHGIWIRKAWMLYLESAGLGPVPEKLAFAAGAEFLVSKDRILAHPRQFYLNSLAFIDHCHKHKILGPFELAVVFEAIWHILFGEKFLFKMTLDVCELYRCL